MSEKVEDLLGIVTKQDILDAIRFFSSNSRTITHDDVKEKMEAYFPNLPSTYHNLIVEPPSRFKKSLTKEVDVSDLLELFAVDDEKNGGNDNAITSSKQNPMELAAYLLFAPDRKGQIPDNVLKQLVVLSYNKAEQSKKSSTILHYDKKLLLQAFDKDHDNELGLDDLRKLQASYVPKQIIPVVNNNSKNNTSKNRKMSVNVNAAAK